MKTTANSYLKLIPFLQFDLWDTKRYTSKSLSSAYNIVELGSCINEENKKYKLYEEEYKEFGILGVNNKTGIFDAYLQKGKDINQAYKKMDVGWIAYNPYRINVGSIGIRLAEHKYEYISPAYVVFSCKDNILPEYLFLLFKTDIFNKVINESTTGSVRQNLTMDVLKKLKIPLPTINEQNILVDNYYNVITQVETLYSKKQNIEFEIDNYFTNKLGIEKKEQKNIPKGLQVFEFKNFDRWDIWIDKGNSFTDKYKTIKFGDIVLGKPIYGANVKGVKIKSDTRYIRITDINENGTLNDEFVSPELVEEKYLLKENDFLIARSGNTVGKTFLYKEKYGRAIYAGYLVNYHLDLKKVIPEYVLEYTKSYSFKQWITSNQRIAGQPNINGQEYLQAPIVVPSLIEQKEILSVILDLKKQIQEINKAIENIKKEAEQEFENAIFNS